MLFNFSWLYRFALEDNTSLSQLDVFAALFPDTSDYDQGTCSKRARGKLPLSRAMLCSMEEDDVEGAVEARIKKLRLGNIDAVCRNIAVLLSDEDVVIDGEARKKLLGMYSELHYKEHCHDKRLAFIAEALKISVTQSDSKKIRLPDWVPCGDAELSHYREQKKCAGTDGAGTIPVQQMPLEDSADLAVELSRQGRNLEALRLRKHVLEERRKIYAPESEEVLRAEANLATTYNKLGCYQEALSLREHVLKERRKLYGSESEEVLLAEANLATTYSKLGRYEEALSLREHVLKRRRELYGDGSEKVLLAESNLAATYSKFAGHTE